MTSLLATDVDFLSIKPALKGTNLDLNLLHLYLDQVFFFCFATWTIFKTRGDRTFWLNAFTIWDALPLCRRPIDLFEDLFITTGFWPNDVFYNFRFLYLLKHFDSMFSSGLCCRDLLCSETLGVFLFGKCFMNKLYLLCNTRHHLHLIQRGQMIF